MRTVYDHTSNIIDLAELRRRREPTPRDSLARRLRERLRDPKEASGFRPVVLTATREERLRARRERQAWYLEVSASLAVILMTAAVTLRVLI